MSCATMRQHNTTTPGWVEIVELLHCYLSIRPAPSEISQLRYTTRGAQCHRTREWDGLTVPVPASLIEVIVPFVLWPFDSDFLGLGQMEDSANYKGRPYQTPGYGQGKPFVATISHPLPISGTYLIPTLRKPHWLISVLGSTTPTINSLCKQSPRN